MKSFKHVRLAVAVAVIASGAMGGMIASQRTGAAMTTSAQAFLASLTPEQRAESGRPARFGRPHALAFHPDESVSAQGAAAQGDDGAAAQARAHELLQAGLSQRGYTDDDDHERARERSCATSRPPHAPPTPGARSAGLTRDPELYFFSIFGTPWPKGAWGWRVEGHHISLHFTVANGSAVVAAPTFFGTNPAEVREGPKKGLRDRSARRRTLARALVMALDDAQKKTAIFTEVAPNDIVTMTKVTVDPLTPAGVAASTMTADAARAADAADRGLHGQMTADIAAERKARIREGGRREDRLRVGGSGRSGRAALLPRAGPDVPDRVRQHAEQRQPHPLGVARLRRRFRPRPAARTPRGGGALSRWTRSSGVRVRCTDPVSPQRPEASLSHDRGFRGDRRGWRPAGH